MAPPPDLAEQLKALSEPVRLRILRALPRENRCELLCNVSELATDLSLPQSTVSRHLAVLLRADLVMKEQHCRDVYYRLKVPTLDRVRAALGALGLS